MEVIKELNDVSLKMFFKTLYKEVLKVLDENPNNRVKVKIEFFDFGGETTVDVVIEEDYTTLIPTVDLK